VFEFFQQSFFGMIRGAGGQKTHPEPTTFCQLFRLLSIHSLVCPPKGSNIPGVKLLKSLITLQDTSITSKEEKRMHFEMTLYEIVEKGKN